jgi:hypothetical protein
VLPSTEVSQPLPVVNQARKISMARGELCRKDEGVQKILYSYLKINDQLIIKIMAIESSVHI